uniref:Uncharacterized protein n=1 Tax=Acrobeloides nanus TaxID=290746 RepID=A0A914D9P3_9BILA
MRRLHALVISQQVHRCNSKSQCHKSGQCSKRYPKPYCEQTYFDGLNVVYRRRHLDNGGNTVLIHSGDRVVRISNADIVPYNIFTLLDLENHHDLEVINSATAIGYILKYEYKGCDKSYIAITKAREGDNTIVDYDEPKAFRLV